MKLEDKQLIKDFAIAATISGIIVIGTFLIMIFIFFYGSPTMIVLAALLLMLRIKVCDAGTEISFTKIIQKYLKISITIEK